MNITQLKNKVKELGEVRAYYAVKSTDWELEEGVPHFGFRGNLVMAGEDLQLRLDDSEDMGKINCASWVHAPVIGHYSWG